MKYTKLGFSSKPFAKHTSAQYNLSTIPSLYRYGRLAIISYLMSSLLYKHTHHFKALISAILFIPMLLALVACDVATTNTENIDSINNNGDKTTGAFKPVSNEVWNDTSVRKVLFTFAYGGHASDTQIATWANMTPEEAINEILTFDYGNEKLSPSEDATSLVTTSGKPLQNLQAFWGGSSTDNPMRWDKREKFSTLTTDVSGKTRVNQSNLRQTWVQAVNTRGLNPFLYEVGFYLSNYQLSITEATAGANLVRSYNDEILDNLASGKPFTTIISTAAKSAASARRYGHTDNTFDNVNMVFKGNDDFAREYFQLFFRLQGETEDKDYHEGVSIENNAKLLTGMKLDRRANNLGSNNANDWYLAPVSFTDHYAFRYWSPTAGKTINNRTNHFADCLEILHKMICGATAAEKIDALSPIVAAHPEVMRNLPAYIIGFFADDRLTEQKKDIIAKSWKVANDDLLSFLRAYAISSTFLSEDTVKFKTTFNRNLTLHNTVVLDNEEAFLGREIYDSPTSIMQTQGGIIFRPAHDVFGAQSGKEAAGNPNIFKSAYDASLFTTTRLARSSRTYFTDETQTSQKTWNKHWETVVPANSNGQHVVSNVADWLWNRMIADGGKNFDIIARSQVLSLLAYGQDFGYTVTQLNPEVSTDDTMSYSSAQLKNNPSLVMLMQNMSTEIVTLDKNDLAANKIANERISYAADFIAMMPYTFAQEGK